MKLTTAPPLLLFGSIAVLLVSGGIAPEKAQQPKSADSAPTAGPNSAPAWPVTALEATVQSATVSDDLKLRANVWLTNSTGTDQPISVDASIRSVAGASVPIDAVTFSPSSVPVGVSSIATKVQLKGVARDDFPLSGWLTITSSDRKYPTPIRIALTNVPLNDLGGSYEAVLAGSLLLALLGVIVGGSLGKSGLSRRMGRPMWSFTESWSSALAFGGPLLTGLVNYVGLPDYPHSMSKKTYMLTSLILSSAIGLAPSIFGLIKLSTPVVNPDGQPSNQVQGVVFMFLVASLLALTGCLGQVSLARLLFLDLESAHQLSTAVSEALAWSMVVLAVAILISGVASIRATIQAQAPKPTSARAHRPETATGDEGALPAPEGVTPLPNWSLL